MSGATPASIEHLLSTLRDVEERAGRDRLTLAHFLESLGSSSFSLVCLCLSVPFLQPISVGPLATAGGLTFTLLGWQMLRQHDSLRLPRRVSALAPGAKGWKSISKVLGWLVSVSSRFSRPRMVHWTEGRRGDLWIGSLIIAGGLVMAVPFVGVPLNNTFPALAIAFAALARLFRDGVMLFISAVWLGISVVYLGFIIWATVALGGAGWDKLKAWLG